MTPGGKGVKAFARGSVNFQKILAAGLAAGGSCMARLPSTELPEEMSAEWNWNILQCLLTPLASTQYIVHWLPLDDFLSPCLEMGGKAEG
jgi:hypothetical protein